MTHVPQEELIDVLVKSLGIAKKCNDFDYKVKNRVVQTLNGEIKECISPTPKTVFQHLEEELRETVYKSYWNTPVGKTRDQTPYLPKGLVPLCETFGKPTDKSISAGELINPKKTAGEIIYEDRVNHDLYVFTHNDYYPGEKVKRKYAKFNSSS